MYFTGDPSSRRKVDLRGKSNKESDRQKLLEKARLEREQRRRIRLQNQSAARIQKFFRGRRVVAAARAAIRNEFFSLYSNHENRADSQVFKPSSKYLPQLFFFFKENDAGDWLQLLQTCRLLQESLRESDNVVAVFTENVQLDWPAVEYRVKRLSRLCISALHFHRSILKDDLLKPTQNLGSMSNSATLLLDTVLILSGNEIPWAGSVVDNLVQNRVFYLFRSIFLTVDLDEISQNASCLECGVFLLASRHMQGSHNGNGKLSKWDFPSEILSIPLLWQRFPSLKQECIKGNLLTQSIHQIASSLQELDDILPADTSQSFPSIVCLLGNIIEVAEDVLSEQRCTLGLATDFALVARHLMERLPSFYPLKSSKVDDGDDDDDDMDVDGPLKGIVREPALDLQLQKAASFDLLRNLVRVTCLGSSLTPLEKPSSAEALAVGAVCAYLYASMRVLPSEMSKTVMTGLAYRANLVPQLWEYVRRCYLLHVWPYLEVEGRNGVDNQLPRDLMGWMLPLAVFCPVFSYVLATIDNEEFYEQQKPISLEDLSQVVLVLKEALWQILWVMALKAPSQKQSQNDQGVFSQEGLRDHVGDVAANLLAMLHDRNSRRQFTSPQDFHAREAVDENFFTQAEGENTRAQYLLRKAPFLVPFTDRVRIYTTQLTAARRASNPNLAPTGRRRVRIRRDCLMEDAFSQLNTLSEESLRGKIQVKFVNEFGVEEAGIDGGGIFKDFMENITKVAFDIQYGLFKETADHLLYPNPSSSMVHDDHLEYFEFLGKILGKAMFEGILVDIPFATFFLSKLRNKHNFLLDLPSLDPELHRSLLFLKNYEGDLSQLGLYFSIENNEYGEQLEIELLPHGKDEPVTNANKIYYIHLVANHRLNTQIRPQSRQFLRGFQQLIKTEWINMFNENELQILISGSQEGMDVNDLRANVNYGGGYSENHPVIEMFWDVVKTLDLDLQRKFLKFVTGCSRGPLLGFKYLQPQFCIQRAGVEDAPDETLDRLPTSATCVNLLKLPPYKSKETIQEKLTYAITAGAGFDLS